MKRTRRDKEINFSFDSLADIVSNILGILVILGVLVGMMSKFNDKNKKEDEREAVFGKKDAMVDLLQSDNRRKIPFERAARYNRFHLHVVCWKGQLFFIDSAEFNLKIHEFGVEYFSTQKEIGSFHIKLPSNVAPVITGIPDFKMPMMRGDDKAFFYPIESKGFKPVKSKFSDYTALRQFFKLSPSVNAKENRNKTKVSPNNHIIHFYVFPDSIRSFNIGNDYLRMLGFDTGWELMPVNKQGSVRLPIFLTRHTNNKNMHVQ